MGFKYHDALGHSNKMPDLGELVPYWGKAFKYPYAVGQHRLGEWCVQSLSTAASCMVIRRAHFEESPSCPPHQGANILETPNDI